MNDVLKKLIKQFMPFAQKQIGFKNPPRLFLRTDQENAKNPLGRTAHYDPNEMSVTLYVCGRHPKDILRSLGHELVHHKQNCDGKFSDSDDMGPGYAQKDPHLRRMEQEANRDGSMCLRDFEDMLKKQNTIYYEHLQKGDNKMSTKDWKNEEIRTILAEAWGFKFNTLEEFDAFNGEGEIQAEAEEEIEEADHSGDEKNPERADETVEAAASEEAVNEEDETLEEEEEIEEADDKDKKDKKVKMVPQDEVPEGAEVIVKNGPGDLVGIAAESRQELEEAITALLRKHLRG